MHTGRHTVGWWSAELSTVQSKEHTMPLINVKVIEGVFTDDQKTQIAERLTDAMVSVEGENMRGVTWCVIDEVKSGDWAIGGQCLTTEAVHALAAGQPA
jgi:4-oxalocrotonate tautomerase